MGRKLGDLDQRKRESVMNPLYFGRTCAICGLEANAFYYNHQRKKYVWKHNRLVGGITKTTYHEAE